MVLQTTGQIKYSHIKNEFGGSNVVILSNYIGVDTNIPKTSNNIKISNFYGATKPYTISLSGPGFFPNLLLANDTNYRYIPFVFQNTGSNVNFTYTINFNNNVLCDILIVAGGGGGGSVSLAGIGGGGGAGGLIFANNISLLANTNYNITVGDGGNTVKTGTYSGLNGNNSAFIGGMVNLIAMGGGGGGGFINFSTLYNGNNGGSGGGGAGQQSSRTGGAGTSGQGFNGASSITSPSQRSGGGGGMSGNATTDGNGANGIASILINSTTYNFLNTFGTKGNVGDLVSNQLYFAGGGAGSLRSLNVSTFYNGGLGGGGNGGSGGIGNIIATGGKINTGGGGGGAGEVGKTAGKGGSGVIILRFK